MKLQITPAFSDSICDLRTRKIKATFFSQINILIDWDRISKITDKDYSRGKSAVGKPSYDGLFLFKMCLLQSWYGLSDYEVEDRLNDSLS
ncbi:transposase, partial [Flavicella sp.]|uniref:transposase n=1 Tax=Flavicella sp. TaxID=2957742 RepID=UPI00301891CC